MILISQKHKEILIQAIEKGKSTDLKETDMDIDSD